MEVRIGDKVRFISEKMEGKVTGIIDNRTVKVFCDDYGFEIPASINDLVVIDSEYRASSTIIKGSGLKESKTVKEGLYLAFIPDEPTRLSASRFNLCFVNVTSLIVFYTISAKNGVKLNGISTGSCNPGQFSTIDNFSLKELDQFRELYVEAIFYQKGEYTLCPALSIEIKINPISLTKSGNYSPVEWFDKSAYLRPLMSDNICPEEKQKELLEHFSTIEEGRDIVEKQAKTTRGENRERQSSGNIVEIDLHAGELLESMAGMENKDILEYQLDVFRNTLEKYKLRRGQKIVFIHGKGAGVLKQRMLWELQTKYKRYHHQDASFKQYGYGATMVTIR